MMFLLFRYKMGKIFRALIKKFTSKIVECKTFSATKGIFLFKTKLHIFGSLKGIALCINNVLKIYQKNANFKSCKIALS